MKNKRIYASLILLTLSLIMFAGAFFIVRPKKYSAIIAEYAEQFNLSPEFVSAVIKVESRFDPTAQSKRGAKGLMQIMDMTGEWGFLELEMDGTFDPDVLFDPATNVKIGCWYLAKLMHQFGDADVALAAYNAGSGNVSSWLKNVNYSDGTRLLHVPYSETRSYIRKVNKFYNLYKMF